VILTWVTLLRDATTMLAARRRPGKLPEGFYAAAEKEADAQIRKESRPRPRPLSNKTV
jgi:hypothetical protein